MPLSDLNKHIPNTIYEIIAYFVSGTVFLAISLAGFAERTLIDGLATYVSGAPTLQIVLILIGLGVLTYAYGQLASAMSSTFVAEPVWRLVRLLGTKASPDFSLSFAAAIDACGFGELLPERKKDNKWTLMFYLLVHAPAIGRDIMKRYAREKLARINAFNSGVLFVSSLLAIVLRATRVAMPAELAPHVRTPSLWFVFVTGSFVILFSWEYYRRKCWNNDLLLKVFPVVRGLEVSRLGETASQGTTESSELQE